VKTLKNLELGMAVWTCRVWLEVKGKYPTASQLLNFHKFLWTAEDRRLIRMIWVPWRTLKPREVRLYTKYRMLAREEGISPRVYRKLMLKKWEVSGKEVIKEILSYLEAVI